MRYLWLTLADPDPPHNGQFVFSGGLIRACAQAGAELSVLGLTRPESRQRDGENEGNVVWHLPSGAEMSRWSSLASLLPHQTNRCNTPNMRAVLATLLDSTRWDSIVFDSICAGWALHEVLRRKARGDLKARLVYISHNHEASLRRSLAHSNPNILKRQAHLWDASKTRRLENVLIGAVDLMTAITPEDCARYRAEWPGKRIELLSPGYSGRQLPVRRITSETPRRAIVVGSFDWIAKRINIEEFVRAADPIFACQDMELQIVGSGDRTYLDQLGSGLAATSFTGKVDRVERYMDGARIAILPERVGGGFKLKALEYVFNRVPILALAGSVVGTPLQQNASVLLFPDHGALARGVSHVMDNLGKLNQLQEAAYAACRDAFHWETRGQRLVGSLAAA